MNRLLITLLFIGFLPFISFGQYSVPDTIPPKVRANTGFFSTTLEIGDKTVTENEMLIHFSKFSMPAYDMYKSGKRQEGWGWGLLGVAFGAIIINSVQPEEKRGLTLPVIGLGAAIGSLVFTLSGPAKKDQAIKLYNTQYGY